jgi:DNA polymerase beta
MGFCQLDNNPLARRIDIRYVPYKSYYTALLYYTGSKNFNIEMRSIALKWGL